MARMFAGRLLNPLRRHLRKHGREVENIEDFEALRKVARDPKMLDQLEEQLESRVMDGAGLRAVGELMNDDSWPFLQWLWDHRKEILELVLLIVKVA